MLSKEFKKNNHFRNCADRNCFNCKHRWKESFKTVGPGEVVGGKSYCWFDEANPSTRFYISNFTVCDNWELDKNFKAI